MAAVLLTSCTAQPHPPDRTPTPTPAASARPSAPPGTVVWSVDRDRPAGQHVLVGDVLVGYVVKLRRLVLRAIDPVTGLIIWERPASPGNNPPGVSTPVQTYGEKIIYLAPDSDDHYRAAVTILVAESGAVHAATEHSYAVDGTPQVCGSDICFHDLQGHDGRSLSMDPDTGAVRKTATYRGRIIGSHGLTELTHDDQPSTLGRIRDGKIIWEVPFSRIFGSGFSPDGGWRWHYDSKADMFTGEVGWVADGEKVDHEEMDRHSIMVGLDAETGRLRWKEVGTTRFCPPVGAAEFDDSEIDHFRCRFDPGSIARYGKAVSFHNVRMTLERFEPRTGLTIWAAPVQSFAGSYADYEATAARIDDDHILLTDKEGPRQINLTDGQGSQLSAIPALWCSTIIRRPYLGFYDESDSHRLTGSAETACDRTGKPAKITTAIPDVVGVHADTRVIVTSETSVTAYRQWS